MIRSWLKRRRPRVTALWRPTRPQLKRRPLQTQVQWRSTNPQRWQRSPYNDFYLLPAGQPTPPSELNLEALDAVRIPWAEVDARMRSEVQRQLEAYDRQVLTKKLKNRQRRNSKGELAATCLDCRCRRQKSIWESATRSCNACKRRGCYCIITWAGPHYILQDLISPCNVAEPTASVG